MRKMRGLLALLMAFFAFTACGDANSSEGNNGLNKESKEEPEEYIASTGRVLDLAKPSVAITFDDGPNMTNSVLVLDALEQRGIVATYFVIAQNINDETVEVMRRGYSLGCEYAPHSWDWGFAATKGPETYRKEIIGTSQKIIDTLGEGARSAFFRFHGDSNAKNIEVAAGLGYPFIEGIWAQDWLEDSTPESIYKLIVSNVEDGIIIGLHDGSGNNATAEAIGDILDALIEQGYQFLTLTELFEMRNVPIEPGVFYQKVN